MPDKLPWHVLEVKRGVFIGNLAWSYHFSLNPIFLTSSTHLVVDNDSVRFSLICRTLKLVEWILFCQRVLLAHLANFGRRRCALALITNGTLTLVRLPCRPAYLLVQLLVTDCEFGSATHDIW